jgi:molybdopterin molybdotransferase
MIGFDEAIGLTLALARPLEAERASLPGAEGRILAVDLVARGPSPRADVSAMDGYAVRASDVATGSVRLRIIGESFPGQGYDGDVGDGQAVRIFTGAPIPAGSDRVVIQENVRREGDQALIEEAQTGAPHIRRQGSDFNAGEVLLPAGRRLDARAMVAAGAADRSEVEVFRQPRVVVLGTGDELCEPGSAHTSRYGIPESVSLGVAALADAWGGESVGRLRLKDDLPSLRQAAREALEAADVAVVTGGASVGERDFAKAMFEDAGLELVFSKVEIKPGKPVWLGKAMGRLVLGLPGNPTSAMVTGRLFLAPLIAGLSGQAPQAALHWRADALASDLPATGDRETFYRGRTTPNGLEVFSDQDSGSQKVLAQADRLIRRRAGAPEAAPGENVDALDF